MNRHLPRAARPTRCRPASAGSGRLRDATIAGEAPDILKGENTVEGGVENNAGLVGGVDSDQRRRSKSLRVPPCWI